MNPAIVRCAALGAEVPRYLQEQQTPILDCAFVGNTLFYKDRKSKQNRVTMPFFLPEFYLQSLLGRLEGDKFNEEEEQNTRDYLQTIHDLEVEVDDNDVDDDDNGQAVTDGQEEQEDPVTDADEDADEDADGQDEDDEPTGTVNFSIYYLS